MQFICANSQHTLIRIFTTGLGPLFRYFFYLFHLGTLGLRSHFFLKHLSGTLGYLPVPLLALPVLPFPWIIGGEHQSWFETGHVINSYLSPQRKPSGPVMALTLQGPTRRGRRLNRSPTGPERHCRRWYRRVTGPNFTRRIEQTARWSGGVAAEWSVAF
jgi:hypothetical protein